MRGISLIMTKIQLTQKGFNDLQLELENLIKNKKSKAIDRLSKARSMGDLKENSEYTAAKEELALVEERIQEINNVLGNAEVTLMYKAGNKIEIGSTVTVDIKGQKDTFQIVGEFEADPMNKKLSQNSPIGQALIDKKIGDLVEINIPAGKIQYKIIEIK